MHSILTLSAFFFTNQEEKLKKVVKQLVDLQEIDSRFDALQLQKGDLPVIIQETEEDLEMKLADKKENEESIQKGEADRRMFQLEIEASNAKLKQYEEQLYRVQTNKEYDAISLEIDTKKMEIKELENKILQSLEEEEDYKKNIEELDGEIKKLESQLLEYKTELEDIMKHTKAEEAQLEKQRDKILSVLDKRYQRQYEKIRKAKGGLAVVAIKKNSCGGCFSAIPPQKIVEIREMNRLYTCEHCGRILVWTDNLYENNK
jgi:predicted  nucleic acid-binding Zn-ribbon protein